MKLAALAFLGLLSPRQEDAGVAIVHVRVLTVTKGEIDSGTILIKGEKIVEIGKDVKVPPGVRVVEGKGLVAFPGMVNAASRIGAFDPGGGGPNPLIAAADEVNPASDVFTQALRTGITTYGVHPATGGAGALLKPVGLQKETMILDRAGFLRITLQANTGSKEALKQALEGAKRQLEAEKKNPKPAAPAGKADEKAPPFVRFLRGEIPALVSLAGPSDVLHFWQILDAYAEYKPRVVLLAPADVYKAAEELGKRKSAVLLRPDLVFAPSTRDRVNAAAELSRAGAVVGFAPGADMGDPVESYLYRVAEMVKYGMPRDAALKALTIVPAEMLGIEKRVGSLEAGKDADVLLFDGDPLGAGARLRRSFINGTEVYSGE